MRIKLAAIALLAMTTAASAQEVYSGSQAGSTSYNNVQIGGQTSVTDLGKSVPSMGAPGMHHTASCALSASGALSGSGFGLAFGRGRIDDECNTREESRFLHDLLRQKPSTARRAAIHHACANDKSMRATLVAVGVCVVK